MNYKNIHIGALIKQRVEETGLCTSRIGNFFKCTDDEVAQMYLKIDLSTDILLKWSKLLEYDFFRVYSHHLILYSPSTNINKDSTSIKSKMPQFRKNIYTTEIIQYIIEEIETGKMTKNEVMERYRIPKTTLYKWLSKYKKTD